jgi:NAD+ kinase
MTMPIDLVLVRHGESEGNVVYARARLGDHGLFTPAFQSRHSSRWRLTRRGVEQARVAGAWLRQHVAGAFDRYYVSEYLRAMETAGHLGFDQATWFPEFYLRERDWGAFDLLSHEERRQRYRDDFDRRELDTFYWTPPGGESMASLCLRIDRVLNTLHRECADQRVLVVCHGEVMWGFRVRLERMTQERYHDLDRSREPRHKLHNCQVLHYTRREPGTGAIAPYLNWMRSVCPWDPTCSDDAWQEVHRPRCSSADLLALVQRTPHLWAEEE